MKQNAIEVRKAMLTYLPDEALEATSKRQPFHSFTSQVLDTSAKLGAELKTIRALDCALDREEQEPGIICYAVPILGGTGRVFGAPSGAQTADRTSLTALETLAGRITKTTENIPTKSESWRFPEQK